MCEAIHSVENPCCPRCGYDQRGTIGTWDRACPLLGICTECGLEFNWSEVLRPEMHEPPWCIEFVRGWRSIVRGGFSTLLRMLWPWGFWSQLKMSHAIRWRRILLLLMIASFMFLLAYAVEQSTIAVRLRYLIGAETSAQSQANQVLKQQIQNNIRQIETQIEEAESVDWTMIYPSGSVTQEEIVAALQETLQQYKSAQQAAVPVVRMSYWQAVTEAVIFPVSWNSAGTIGAGINSVTYPAPAWIHEAIDDRNSPGWGSRSFGEFIAFSGVMFVWWMTALVFMPASFVLLPISRRRAKVRWIHVGRVFTYSFVGPLLIAAFATMLVGLAFLFPASWQFSLWTVNLLTGLGMGAFLFCWWWTAIARYMKIPGAFFVALLLLFMCMLLTPTVVVLAHQAVRW